MIVSRAPPHSCLPLQLALTLACVGLAVTLPAKLDQVAARAQGYNLQPPQQSGYNYEPPQQPANLYEVRRRISSGTLNG